MTVAELIEKLRAMPQDATVFFEYDNGHRWDYFGCEIVGAYHASDVGTVQLTGYPEDDSP